jgi:sugar phosphate isomerase/epimerase
MDNIGIERLCVFGMPPVEFVHLAADLGCRHIGTALLPARYYNPHHYPDWSLRDDAALRREMRAAMRERGVAISLCEGFGVRPDAEVREYARDLEILRELGGARINAASSDRDLPRSFDQLAQLAEMAAGLGIETTIEVGAGPIRTLAVALEAVRHVGRPGFRLLIDTMHYLRFAGTAAELAVVDPEAIGYVQLCDAPRVSPFASYMEEALHERLPPGSGELPLAELLRVLPRGLVFGLEVPQRSLAQAGVGPHERVGRCVQAARELLASLAE